MLETFVLCRSYIATIGKVFWSHIPQNAGKIMMVALRTARVLCTNSLTLAKSYSYDLNWTFLSYKIMSLKNIMHL